MAQRYWVATSGGTWNSTSSWSATSGGASGASIPTQFDDVFFDANSITSANRIITIDSDSCRDLDCTGIANTPTFRIINTGDLFIYGNITLPATGMRWQSSTGVSGLMVQATNRSISIDTNGSKISDYIYFNQVNLRIELLSDLNIDSIQFGETGQTFITNGYTVTTGALTSGVDVDIEAGSSVLNFRPKISNSTFVLTDGGTTDFSNSTINITLTGTNIITIGGHSFNTINIYGSGTATFSGDDSTISTLNITSGTTNMTGDSKIESLTVQRGATLNIGDGDKPIVDCTNNGTLNITVNEVYIDKLTVGRSSTTKPSAGITLNINSLISNGAAGALAVIESATAGTTAYINMPTGVFENNFLDIQDITLVGGGSWYAGANSTNGGNNANILFMALPDYLGDKLVSYFVYSGVGGDVIGELGNVINKFQYSNEINTGGGAIKVELLANPNDNHSNSLYSIDNHIEVWIKDRQAPNGMRIFQGYISSVDFDYDNEKVILNIGGYGEKLEKYIILTADTVDQSVTATDGQCSTSIVSYPTDLTGYAYYQFTTGGAITNISSIEMMLSAPAYYLGFFNVRVKLFRTAAAAENITTDTSIATTAYVNITNSGAERIKMTFTEPITVSPSTTYYYRLEVQNTGSTSYVLQIHGDNSAGASAGVRVYYTGTWQYPSYVTQDTIYPYLNTYTSTEDTTITYSTTEISEILKSIIDSYNTQGGNIIYTPLSIENTGVSITHTFNTDNVKNGLDFCQSAAPRGWFYYVDNSTNIIYFKSERSVEFIDHRLPKGGGLSNVKLRVDGSNITNTIYFTGGDTGGGDNLFTKYINTDSIIVYGKRAAGVSDGRVTVAATASVIGEGILDQYAESNIIIEATVLDNNKGTETIGYDLESLRLGQNIMLTGYSESALFDSAIFDVDLWDSYLQALSNQVLQIVRIDYGLDKVVFKLNLPSATIFSTITSSKRNLDILNTTNNPVSPS